MRLDRPVVVDASVAVKWLVAEEYSSQAQALYEAMGRARQRVVAPPHFTGEVLNALYQRTRRRGPDYNIPGERAEQLAAGFLRLGVEVESPEDLHLNAFRFARAQRLPNIYDALYVVLAQTLGTELWTADLGLLQDVGAAAPCVRWIGDYEPSG